MNPTAATTPRRAGRAKTVFWILLGVVVFGVVIGVLVSRSASTTAAQQGAYEPMYQKMFQTQTQWSHQQADQSAVFRGYTQDLDLDMAAYDAAVADPATGERIELDAADGTALGVEGTPTF